jgi:hypothetical protein
VDSPVPRLVCLESSANSFPADLESLDRLSPRTFDTILAYYVRAGQANPQVIFKMIFKYLIFYCLVFEFSEDISFPDLLDILRRIRILGSVRWITYPDPDPALFFR